MSINNLLLNGLKAIQIQDKLSKGILHPSLDFVDYSDYIMLYIELPGVNRSSIEVSVTGNILKVQGIKTKPYYDKVLTKEINYGMYERSITLSFSAKNENIKIEYVDGVINIKILKMFDDSFVVKLS